MDKDLWQGLGLIFSYVVMENHISHDLQPFLLERKLLFPKELLGAGAQGFVFKTIYGHGIATTVAVKRIPIPSPELLTTKDALMQFFKEVNNLRSEFLCEPDFREFLLLPLPSLASS